MVVVTPKSLLQILLSLASSSSSSIRGAIARRSLARRSSPETNTIAALDSMPSPRVFAQDFLIVAGLALVQIVNAAYMVLLTPILNLGIKPLLLIIFGNLTTSIFVLPFAVIFERVTTFQALLLQGLKKTSPAIASAMPNLAPGVIFIIAACFGYIFVRFEKVNMKCKYSMTKILGTMACLSGAITMSFLQGPSASSSSSSLPPNENMNQDWFIGCSCLLGAVLVMSCTTVLQAAVMIHFQAPFTLCAVTSSLGVVITAIVQIVTGGNLDIGTPAINIWILIAVILLGGMLTASCLAFQTWCVMKKGPVLVSMFSPIQTVCSAVLASLLLGKFITLGSVGGMLVLFMGLYMVLWAKKKEGLIYEANKEHTRDAIDDIEQPLLS
ncbi:putative EamA domain-containing protein [Dioscorea sansibarensis]